MVQVFQEIVQQASEIVLDKREELHLSLACFLAGGHLLIEDVPGVGKTTLVHTLGKLTGLETRRIQFTVDLLPADILGSQIFNPQQQKFEFHPGPIFSQLVMTDELNRASPRTQSALLQAMEEGHVSLDGQTWPLPKPFHVIATQNPHQQMGTFALPESQLDRFLMSLELHYASRETEIRLFRTKDPRLTLEGLKPLLSAESLLSAQRSAAEVTVSEKVAQYVGDLLEKSRQGTSGALPLSTRAGLALVRAGKARAFVEGRDYLRPEDIQSVLVSVLGHRLGGNHGLRKGREWAQALQRETAVPV
ncbi:MAG TPA: AAA family ATPase [Pseudobdellovibrionaceae bacterium]|nr:AAA family ATPase [Pseudobdellovibrionaceae bacterium]